MAKVSIIIASRGEIHEGGPGVTVLQRMIQDIYEKCPGEFEVLVTFDGPPRQPLPNYPNLTRFDLPESIGLKPCVNMMAQRATGKYLLKFDSHCMVSEGIDEVLQDGMEENWIVVPRFRVLNAEKWEWQDDKFYDYFFLHCPLTDPDQFKFKAKGHDRHRTLQRVDIQPLDETMTMHGSGYFISRDFFLNRIGGWSSVGYDTFGFEHVEPAAKVWLVHGGKVMVNKKAWYAHMHKGGQRARGYPLEAK